MQIRLRPFPGDHHPAAGFIVAGEDPDAWLDRIKVSGLAIADLQVYPLPGLIANSVWGCLVLCSRKFGMPDRVNAVYLAAANLYLPAFTKTFPALTKQDCQQIFGENPHLFHPLLGLIELPEPISWSRMMLLPAIKSVVQQRPAKPVHLPQTISAFLVERGTDEEILQQMQQGLFPQQQSLEEKPLTVLEQIKLFFYSIIFKLAGKPGSEASGVKETAGNTANNPSGKTKSILRQFINRIKSNPKLSGRIEKIKEDFANLEERNKKEMDRLIDMLDKDPLKALQYAIPIDDEGLGRGSGNQSFTLSRRWFDFDLGGSSFSGGSVSVGDSTMNQLRQKYYASAQLFIKNGQDEKAAFVYLRLLNQPIEAARVLKEGGFYAEAAAIYMKKEDKKSAADCYTKGNMIPKAIELYEQLKDYELAGDLAVKINQQNQAEKLFGLAAGIHVSNNRHVKASQIYRHKLHDTATARQVLMDGWIAEKDAVACLHNYFDFHITEQAKIAEMKMFYNTMINRRTSEPFLYVVKQTFNKSQQMPSPMRDIMFAIISEHASDNPVLLKELKYLSPDDEKILRDVIVYRNDLMRKKRLG